jgi:hypothetical protein
VEYFESNPSIKLTRSRAYKKNDNCHVEQKNFTHVRETFGYERIEFDPLIKHMNEIYQDYLNPLLNFFTPQLKLVEKNRVGSRYKRKYDTPKSPYQRLMESSDLSAKQKSDLEREYQKYNPIELKRTLSRKVNEFNRLIKRYNQEQVGDIYLEGFHEVSHQIGRKEG